MIRLLVQALHALGVGRFIGRNEARQAAMRARNFKPRPAVEPWCVVAMALLHHRAKHGLKSTPDGWRPCFGPIDQCHIKPRGMGGCNSDGATVYLCRAHHMEQEGRTEAFEAKYKVNLREAGERQHAGEDEMPW